MFPVAIPGSWQVLTAPTPSAPRTSGKRKFSSKRPEDHFLLLLNADFCKLEIGQKLILLKMKLLNMIKINV